MRISVLIFSAFAFFILLTGARYQPPMAPLTPLSQDSLMPVLPDQPFSYRIINIPAYLQQALDSANSPFLPLLDSITDAGASLGRVLFYDKKLSDNQTVSCASCHQQAFSFGAASAQSAGLNGVLTPRNSMHINHLAFSPGDPVFWDGRIQSIPDQVIMPILHPDEMGMNTDLLLSRLGQTAYYPPLFTAAFGDDQVTLPRIRSALVQFVLSMASFESQFDQMQESGNLNVFTELEQQGWILFQEACVACHIEGHFGTDSMFNIGLDMVYEDPGMAGWTGNAQHIGAFKSPTLRNIALSAPYMHDGRFLTLEEVVNFYSEEVAPHPNNYMATLLQLPQPFRGFRYDETEKAALVAFMHTLTDTAIVSHEKWSDPFLLSSATSTWPKALQFKLFPNPVNDVIHLAWSSSQDTTTRIQVFTLSGIKMLEWTGMGGTDMQIPVSHFPRGAYLLVCKQDNDIQTSKFVIQ
jgi:cytochrome c peroxidase